MAGGSHPPLDPDYDAIYPGKARWMNLGYSESPNAFAEQTYSEQCENLANQLAKTADLQQGDYVIDVGCGFGLQDIFFASCFPGIKIHAINISPNQIRQASELLEHADAETRNAIQFSVADAVDTKLEGMCADKVLSLESAFHYQTREKFFQEAFRLLKPGGTLALADIVSGTKWISPKVPNAIWESRILHRLRRLAYHFQVGKNQEQKPSANNYSIDVYREKLKTAGFIEIEIKKISQHICIWPNQRYAKHAKWIHFLPRPWQHPSYQLSLFIPTMARMDVDYYLVKAVKP